MAILRTYAEVQELDPTEVEQQLIDACNAGEQCVLGSDVPSEPNARRTIRADILRYLILGGCEECPVDGRGVNLSGGYITGMLNLNFGTAKGATSLINCYFNSQFDAIQSRFAMLNLIGSILKGFNAQGAQIKGSVFLRSITTTATIDFNGATIGGQLSFNDARLNATEGQALNAQGAEIKGGVIFRSITATATVDLNGATIGGVDCDGAKLKPTKGKSLNAQGAEIKGHIGLRSITATATVDLHSATIGGVLDCTGAHITTANDYAISAPNARILGGVFLHPRIKKEKDLVETPFYATGEVRFNGATLGGLYAQEVTLVATSSGQTLSLGGATVNGAVRLDGSDSTGEILLAGSRISGRLTCERIKISNENGHAFNGQAMRVEHSFVWKKVEHTSGGVSLNGAHVAELNDDPENWPKTGNLFLDGFTYDRIKGTVSTSPARMGWLENGSFFEGDFRPQPYSQYAEFLRRTGHDDESRGVLFTRERLRRANARLQRSQLGNGLAPLVNLWAAFWDILLRLVVGYGHHPFRSVYILGLLIFCTIVPAHYAWEEGSFAPNAAPVVVSEAWVKFAKADPHPAAVWTGDRLPDGTTDIALTDWQAKAPGRDWETFNRYAYGFDVVIPIIDFGQTEAWAPSTTRGPWGWHLWWGRWVLSVMGWIVTALGAAAITGIIRRE
ncbi:hypothetical protein [Tateyamaria sp.]|uniref:hypothetical protein n=1 Tax=Tateyamaria sp. TaxID=1929288 RepID=UPI00329ABC35